MALLKCLDCGRDVSDLALSCPNCGRPVATMTQSASEPSAVSATPEAPTAVISPAPTGQPKARPGCLLAIVGASVLAGVLIIAALLGRESSTSSTSGAPPTTAQPTTPSPPATAAELLALVKSERAANRPSSALRQARELISAHARSPEAEAAAKLMPELETAVEAEQKAEAGRAAKAAAEEEARRLAAKWRYRVDADPMTSKKARYASIDSENTLNFDFPYQGEQHGTLILRDHPIHGRDVMITIDKGQILCQSYEDCTIRVRFDEGSPQRWNAAGPADNRSTVIFLRNEGGFIQRLRAAKVVRIQIPIYQEGEPMLEFHIGGFDYSKFREGE